METSDHIARATFLSISFAKSRCVITCVTANNAGVMFLFTFIQLFVASQVLFFVVVAKYLGL